MRIVSVNLNQRLGRVSSRRAVEAWLADQRPDLLLTQEPWRPEGKPISLGGFHLVQATPHLATWVAREVAKPQASIMDPRWQILKLPSLTIHNIYLSPYSSRARTEILNCLAEQLHADQPAVVLGDFNLAPRPSDGLFGDSPSLFTKSAERHAFRELLESAKLVDLTSGTTPEFTFERVQKGKLIRFRCDLGLLSACLADKSVARYDHAVRAADGFTDHSAIIVDLPVSTTARSPVVGGATEDHDDIPLPIEDQFVSASYKTAIKRSEPSQVARALGENSILPNLKVESILDFGCGYGVDVDYYRECGFFADGYDREPKFGHTTVRRERYDLVTMVYVVNVLPSASARLDAVRCAARHVRPGGYLLLAARSEAAVQAEAQKGHWQPLNDGWISSPSKNTFQRGIPSAELGWLVGAAGLEYVQVPLSLSRDSSFVFGRRPLIGKNGRTE